MVRDRRKTDAKWQAASKSPQTTPSRDSVHILQQHITPALTPASSQRSPASNVVPQVESPPNDVDKNIEARAYDARGLIKSDKNYCLQESTPDGPHGRVSKTRFFGQSHWMNSITAVWIFDSSFRVWLMNTADAVQPHKKLQVLSARR